MLAIELVRDRQSKEPADRETAEVLARCHERGLVVMKAGAYGNVIRFLPPLVINDDELDAGLEILEGSLRDASKK